MRYYLRALLPLLSGCCLLTCSLSLKTPSPLSTPSSSSIPSPSTFLSQEPTYRLLQRPPRTSLLDVVSVLGRFKQRSDFYEGSGYIRPDISQGGLLTKDLFYTRLQRRKFDASLWPVDPKSGALIGTEGLGKKEIEALAKQLQASEVSRAGSDAVFASFAKGALNGVAYPEQVDEEMRNWLSIVEENNSNNSSNGGSSKTKRVLSLRRFEDSLLRGKLAVFLGWFLYIGLQFGGVYVVFFAPIASYFFPGKSALKY